MWKPTDSGISGPRRVIFLARALSAKNINSNWAAAHAAVGTPLLRANSAWRFASTIKKLIIRLGSGVPWY